MKSSALPTVLWVTAGQCLLGWLGSWLTAFAAIGQDAPVWPAAGWAFLCVRRSGWSGALGVWLGSFAAQLCCPRPPTQSSELALAAAVACGAVLQAGWGAWMARAWRRHPGTLDHPLRVLIYLLLIGPVACAVSPTWTLGWLRPHLMAGSDDFGHAWLQWWTADTLGTLALAPLAEALALGQRSRQNLRRVLIYSQLSLLTLVIAGGVIIQSRQADQESAQSNFRTEVDLWKQLIDQDFAQVTSEIYTLQLMVSRHPEWLHGNPSETLLDRMNYGLISGGRELGRTFLVTLVPHHQRRQIERRLTDFWGDRIRIVDRDPTGQKPAIPSPRRARYYVTTALADGLPRIGLGTDLQSMPERLEAMETARDEARLVSTSLIVTLREPGRRDGVVLFLPVYGAEEPVWVVDRRRQLVGFVGASFQLEDLLQRRLGPVLPTSVHFELPAIHEEPPITPGYLAQSVNATLGGRNWQIRFVASPLYGQDQRALQQALVSVTAILLSLLAGVLTTLVLGREAVVEELVEQRTASLSVAAQQLEAARAHAEEAAQQAALASEAKSAFLATMSHEIRTPMNGVLGLAHLLSDTPLNSQQRDYLETLLASGKSLLTILNDILDFSKIESGRLELEPDDVNALKLTESVLDLFAQPADEQKLHLGLEIGKGLDGSDSYCLRTDPTRVRQILLNLVGNAIKFSGAEAEGTAGSAVTVGVAWEDGFWCWSVRDQGIGMAPQTLKLLFQPFSQADNSIARRFGGTGLGLAICRKLSELLHGELRAESELGKGSVFTLRLPARRCERPPEELPLASLEAELEVELDDPRERGVGLWCARRLKARPGAPRFKLCQREGRLRIFHSADPDRHATLTRPLHPGKLTAALASLTGVETRSTTPQTTQMEGALVLLAEDNLVNRKVATRMLTTLGHRVEVAVNGQEALDKGLAKPYDLVVMDIHMPVMDGLQATRELRSRGVRTPILALTALASKEDEAMCLQAGADAFLSKPVDPDKLRAAIARLLGLS